MGSNTSETDSTYQQVTMRLKFDTAQIWYNKINVVHYRWGTLRKHES